MISVGQILQAAERDPQGTAIVDGSRRFTWEEWADLTARLAGGVSELLRSRSGAPRPVVFVGGNRWEVAALQAAGATLGAPVVGVDPGTGRQVVAACMERLAPVAVFADRAAADSAAAAVAGATCPVVVLPDGDGGAAPAWDALLQAPADPAGWVRLPFVGLGLTSGTTGIPKVVRRTASFEPRRTRDMTARLGIGRGDVYANVVPLSHASGPGWARVFAAAGAPVVLARGSDPEELHELLRRERVTATLLVPPVLEQLVRHVERRQPPGRLSLRLVVTGGRHVAPDLVRRCAACFGDVLHVYYGTTETGLNTLAGPDELSADPTTAGRPLPGTSVAAFGPDGEQLPAGSPGRLGVSGYMVADGYEGPFSAPVVDGAAGRWWLTPDTGWVDAAGSVHVTGRELPTAATGLDVNGLEGWLRDRLALEDAVVRVVPGRGLRLAVSYVPGATAPLGDDEVAKAAAEHVAAQAPVDAVEARSIDAVPYSPTGKVQHDRLAALHPVGGDVSQPVG